MKKTIKINNLILFCDKVNKRILGGDFIYDFENQGQITTSMYFESNQKRLMKSLEKQINKEGIDFYVNN